MTIIKIVHCDCHQITIRFLLSYRPVSMSSKTFLSQPLVVYYNWQTYIATLEEVCFIFCEVDTKASKAQYASDIDITEVFLIKEDI